MIKILFRKKPRKKEEEGLGLKDSEDKAPEKRIVQKIVKDALKVIVREKAELEFKNGKVDVNGEGEILISTDYTSPLYSVQIDLRGSENTSIGKKTIFIPAIKPGEQSKPIWSSKYEINKKALRIIEVERKITSPNGGEPIIIADTSNEVVYNMKVFNNAKNPLTLSISQILPKGTSLVSHRESAGLLSTMGNKLIWEKIKIQPKETAELHATLSIKTSKDEELEFEGYTGIIKADGGTFSGLEVSKIEGKVDVKVNIEKKQDEINQTNWFVRINIENKNDLPVKIFGEIEPSNGKIEETQLGEIEGLTISEDKVILKDMPMGGKSKKTIGPILVKAEETPMFKTKVYGVVSGSQKYEATGTLKGDKVKLKTFKASVVKSVNVNVPKEYSGYLEENEIPTLGEPSLNITVEIANEGTIPITGIELEEFIPKGFSDPNNVKIKIGGKEVSKEKISITVEPQNQIEKDRILKLLIRDVKIDRGKKISVQYVLNAVKVGLNRGQITFTTTAKVQTSGNAPPIILKVDRFKAPEFKVKKLSYNLITEKEVRPLDNDEFEIVLRIENKSIIPVIKYRVETFIPKDFKLLETLPEPRTRKELANGLKLDWIVDKIEPNSATEIVYKVKGIGDYRLEKLQQTEI